MSKWVVFAGLLAFPAGAFADPPARPGTCVRFVEPIVDGPVDRPKLTAEVKRLRPQLLACYREQLDHDSKLAGGVEAKLTVHADGTVGDVSASGLGKPLEACATKAFAGLSLPAAKANSAVRYPLTFIRNTKPVPAAPGAARDKAIIRFHVMCALQEIQYCYERQLLAKPNLEGTVTVHFRVEPDGHVGESAAEGLDPEVASCIAQVMRDDVWFPTSPQGMAVNYPFVFHAARP